MPKVIFLQEAEISGSFSLVRLNNYKKQLLKLFWPYGHFRIEGLKQQNSDIFLCQKLTESFSIFFTLEYKKGEQLLLLSFFDSFDL